ncbi:CHAT domain-containing protein [Verrucosispora sioxanthis]|uniref:CHAT domain-containing protein n=1 Tax=Verrucosispora sioxanthis TaxID=2499994 RepID=UPI001C0F7F63|nr:CHAT domain-containing protein [Verrucosispora sioxanthis]
MARRGSTRGGDPDHRSWPAPRLPAGQAEVRRLARVLPGAQLLTGADATADALTRALDGAGLVHIAAHGTFRADNPQFSTLELAGGPLFAYEWERVARPPGCVVLSACESGLTGIRPGDEVMGFAAVLLALGTRCLIATVLPVPADPTTALMLDLHRRMRAGARPAHALAEPPATAPPGPPRRRSSAWAPVDRRWRCGQESVAVREFRERRVDHLDRHRSWCLRWRQRVRAAAVWRSSWPSATTTR